MCFIESKTMKTNDVRDRHDYLFNGGRAIGYAYNHCVEIDGFGRDLVQQFDDVRRELGGTREHGDQNVWATSVKVSPAKEDNVTPRELMEFVAEVFGPYIGDFQAFMAVHDDNESHITHAHMIVNNVSLYRKSRGGALRITDALPPVTSPEFSRRAQRMAAERGWHAYTADGVSVDAKTWFERAALGKEIEALRELERAGQLDERGRERLGELAAVPPVTRRSKLVTSQDKAIERRGASWKSDLKDRISLARMISADEASFFEALDALSVDHRQSESKKHPDELVYTHPASNGKGIRGDHLGLYWSWWYMKKDLQFRSAAHDGWVLGLKGPILEAVGSMEREEGDPIQSLGHCAGKVVTASKLITALQVLDEHDVHCRQDGLAAWRECVTDAELAELRAAAILVRSLHILPEARGPQDAKRCRPFVNWEGGYGSYAKSDHVTHRHAPTHEYDRQFELGRTAPERDDGLCR